MRYLTTIYILLISVGICSAELPPPPSLNTQQNNTQLQQYLQNLYNNHNVIPIVVNPPNGSRFGTLGDIVIYNGAVWYNTDGRTAWSSTGGLGIISNAPLAGSGTIISPLNLGGLSNFGASGQILQTDGSSVLSWGTISSSGIIQEVYTQTTAQTDSNTAIPDDNTIPQIGEGVQWATCVITPKAATNILEVDVNIYTNNTLPNGTSVAALFETSIDANNALASGKVHCVLATSKYFIPIRYFRVSGTTSALTFRVRIGPSVGAQHAYVSNDLGSTLTSSINIKEFTP